MRLKKGWITMSIADIGQKIPTVEERRTFEELWKQSSGIERFHLATKLCGTTVENALKSATTFTQVCAVMCKKDEQYGCTSIPKK